jgi:hypothetical protein
LTPFYLSAEKDGGSFDAGSSRSCQRVLADAEFLYRAETEPAGLAPAQSYRVSDLELAFPAVVLSVEQRSRRGVD